MVTRPISSRPELAPALHRLCDELTRRLPALSSVDARRILIVTGQARGAARASIRSLCRPGLPLQVRLGRQSALYELTLRPLWFRQSTPERRLEALLHELWHIDPERPGSLAAQRRHRALAPRQTRRALDRLFADARARLGPETAACLAIDGEVLMPAWLTRPVLTGEPQRRHSYGPRDLFLQPVMMITRPLKIDTTTE
ncbi:MAG: hypothetical protein JXR83_03735 [Deltaproteobacteria bacterium]|nr:hypothetical protein [Deltaproteobacteria bacterium]